jgi:dihydrolipoamide dehydrogenase
MESDSAVGRFRDNPRFGVAKRWRAPRWDAWNNASMKNEEYEIVIVGSGAGGAEAALLAARGGARGVLLIEKNLLGGGALHAGMIPMRSLVANVRELRRLRDHSRDEAEAEASLSDWVKRQGRTVATLASELRHELCAAGVEMVRGEATLLGEGRLHIVQEGRQGRPGRIVQAAHIIVATGSKPRDSEQVWPESAVGNSLRFISLAEAPFRIVIIGGGHIGCEFACVYNALGAEVTLVEKGERLLPEMDREAGERLHEEFEYNGIRVRLGEAARAVWGNISSEFAVTGLAPTDEELSADKILVATGRVPNVEGLGLEEAGVQFSSERGIEVDQFLQTSAPGISAIGDVNGLCTLADAAHAQARIAVENARGERHPFLREETPRQVHTDPPVAAIGLLEDQAGAVGRAVEVGSARSRSMTAARGACEWNLVKLIADAGTRQLLGGMIIGEHALDWIARLGAAVRDRANVLEFAGEPQGDESFSAALRSCAGRMFSKEA